MSDKEAFDKIRDVALDFMAGTEADHVKLEGFYLQNGYAEPPRFSLHDVSGEEVKHPVCDEKQGRDLIEWANMYFKPVHGLVNTLREQDIAAGRPPRNIFDMTIYRDGRYEVNFIHDPELDARRKAELEAEEKRWEEEERAAWEALSEEEKAAIEAQIRQDKEFKTQSRQLEQLIEDDPANIEAILDYIRIQAEWAALEFGGWRDIRIEFGPGEPRDDGKAASDLTPVWISEDGEEHYLNLRAPFSVIGAIEQMRALMAEQGRPWERITYHIKPGQIDYEWQ